MSIFLFALATFLLVSKYGCITQYQVRRNKGYDKKVHLCSKYSGSSSEIFSVGAVASSKFSSPVRKPGWWKI